MYFTKIQFVSTETSIETKPTRRSPVTFSPEVNSDFTTYLHQRNDNDVIASHKLILDQTAQKLGIKDKDEWYNVSVLVKTLSVYHFDLVGFTKNRSSTSLQSIQFATQNDYDCLS